MYKYLRERMEKAIQENQAKINLIPDLQNRLKEMSEKINCGEETVKMINALGSQERKDYYNCLYRLLINHIIAYRVLSTGFVEEASRAAYSKMEFKMHHIVRAQPILMAIPFIGQFAELPCLFLS
jgi:hypothetical protein